MYELLQKPISYLHIPTSHDDSRSDYGVIVESSGWIEELLR